MKEKTKHTTNNKTLSDLVEYLSDQLQNPVLLETTSFELITYSGNYQILDDVRKNTILSKKAPAYIISCLIEEKVIDAIETSRQPIRIPAIKKIDFTERIAFCIRDVDVSVAYLWVQEASRRLTSEDFDLIKLIGNKIVSYMRQNNPPSQSKDDLIFRRLLEGYYHSEQMVYFDAKMADFTLPVEYTIAVVYTSHTFTLKKIVRFLNYYCLFENIHSSYIKKENQLTILIGKGDKTTEDINLIANRLIQLILNYQASEELIQVGVSNESCQFLGMPRRYLEAMEVINIRKSIDSEAISYFYPRLGIFRLLPVFQETYIKEGYENNTISILNQYDIENRTELLITLEKYITSNCKGKETAEALFIHPNTLNYRMKRITELTQIEFDDINQRTVLYIDLLLQKYKK
ncbi:PucR family transcriptional regulator [Radiobacillus sp. PE A8.2]|uniref:PucR family transcriptional regulator n=1 Tax=Radiobacillus sp. PE A8.2 TaxID=3380349 RepID=UPI00388D4976